MAEQSEDQWAELGPEYRAMMSDPAESSAYLRDIGLKPVVEELLGDCSSSSLLDVGTGGGWLFDLVDVREAHSCDFVRPERLQADVDFKIANAASLPWPDQSFDVVVSNLMLCYAAEIDLPLREMARVTKPGGRLVIGLVHPYFYRTVDVDAKGRPFIATDLSRPISFDVNIGNRVGPFRYFYRPYPVYLNAIIGAGWTVQEVRDWFIDAERYRRMFPHGDSLLRSERIPLFTFFSCSKAL